MRFPHIVTERTKFDQNVKKQLENWDIKLSQVQENFNVNFVRQYPDLTILEIS